MNAPSTPSSLNAELAPELAEDARQIAQIKEQAAAVVRGVNDAQYTMGGLATGLCAPWMRRRKDASKILRALRHRRNSHWKKAYKISTPLMIAFCN